MNDLDESTGANLYLFCMLISTAFVVVLRPSRVDRDQCSRLYQALRRFERIKAQYVLPNLWLLSLELPEFVYSDPKTSEDVVISEEKWVKKIFTIDEGNIRLSNDGNQALKRKCEYIIKMLPKIKASNIHYLPQSLRSDAQKLDIYSLLRSEEARLYTTSINTAIKRFLANGGKRLLGSTAEHMFARSSELAKLMGDLIEVINQDRVPNTDDVISQFLQNRFKVEIEKEYMARFERDSMDYVTNVCKKLSQSQSPLSEQEIATIIKQVKEKNRDLCKKHIGNIICHARHKILGIDSTLVSHFHDENQRECAFNSLPSYIRYRLDVIEAKMTSYQEPILLIERAQHQLAMKDIHVQQAQTKKLLDEAMNISNLKKEELQKQKEIHESLNNGRKWRVGLPPYSCGARGGAYNMLHARCNTNRKGNLYYYCNETNYMVCDSCRDVIQCNPWRARCNHCEARLHATKVF
jgi:hypothetical protein